MPSGERIEVSDLLESLSTLNMLETDDDSLAATGMTAEAQTNDLNIAVPKWKSELESVFDELLNMKVNVAQIMAECLISMTPNISDEKYILDAEAKSSLVEGASDYNEGMQELSAANNDVASEH